MPEQRTRAVVVGAGPYGLSVSAHLRAAGVDHRIVGAPMSLWRDHMPHGMFLKSEGFASSLSDPDQVHTLARYCREHGLPFEAVGLPVGLDTFVGYGLWFQQSCVPQVEPVSVTAIEERGDRFHVEMSDGSTALTPHVVLAMGPAAYARLPHELEGLPGHRVSHSSDHADLSGFRGSHVAVIGAGQSALESAVLLDEQGAQVTLLVRESVIQWNSNPCDRGPVDRVRHPLSPLGHGWPVLAYASAPGALRHLGSRQRLRLATAVLGPAGGWWLRSRMPEALDVRLSTRVLGADVRDDGVLLSVQHDGDAAQELWVDHVIAATGFRVDVDKHDVLSPTIQSRLCRSHGYPMLRRDFESTVPGLFFVGTSAALTFGPVQRFVAGTRFAAERVAARLERSS